MSVYRPLIFSIAIAITFCGFAGAQPASDFRKLARSAGAPQIPGLRIIYLVQLGDPSKAPWQNIILHQTEGAPGAARSLAEGQSKNPTRRGVTLSPKYCPIFCLASFNKSTKKMFSIRKCLSSVDEMSKLYNLLSWRNRSLLSHTERESFSFLACCINF